MDGVCITGGSVKAAVKCRPRVDTIVPNKNNKNIIIF